MPYLSKPESLSSWPQATVQKMHGFGRSMGPCADPGKVPCSNISISKYISNL